QKAATDAFRAAEEALKTARRVPFDAEKAVASARDRTEALNRDQARREARAQALDDTIARLANELAEAEAALAEAQTADAPSDTLSALRDDLTAARTSADQARASAAQAHADRDAEARERAAREQRLAG